MLADLGTALQRARVHGFTEREVEDARAALIAQGEEGVQRETTRPAREVLRQINGSVTRQEPLMSAAQTLALLRRLLPGITATEVSQAFATIFDPRQHLVIAELPSDDGVPSEALLVALGRAAVDVKPDKTAEVARATTLLATLPRGGTVVENHTHAGSGVTSMWLDNGVRVHHRFMDQRKNEARIAITLAGGTIQETAAERGLSEAALRAWDRPATSTLSSTEIRDLMTGAKARVRAGMSGDTVSLTVSGDPTELERGLQLAYLLLTDPRIEPAALEQWKDGEMQRIAASKTQPMRCWPPRARRPSIPGTRRAPNPDRRAGAAISRDAAQGWLRRLITARPSRSPSWATWTARRRRAWSRATSARCPRGRASATRRSPISASSPGPRDRSGSRRPSTPARRRPPCSPASSASTCATSATRGSSTWPRAF
jgi:hypothetical protein